MPSTETLAEAERVMTICNACRYCEGHCAVFPAMELRLDFPAADLNYLAHLCHNCGSCYHHTFYGFMLAFATCVATLYHYAFGWEAPYSPLSLPVVLGTVGGIGLLIGPVGLLWLKHEADPEPYVYPQRQMDVAFLVLLFLSSLTGLLLLFLRATPAMGVLLAVHLGVVLGLFLTMPYGKFVHAIYRFAALVRYTIERRRPPQLEVTE